MPTPIWDSITTYPLRLTILPLIQVAALPRLMVRPPEPRQAGETAGVRAQDTARQIGLRRYQGHEPDRARTVRRRRSPRQRQGVVGERRSLQGRQGADEIQTERAAVPQQVWPVR
jgi:hypothetical protein